ncbi:MAG TPA: hypothetical protein DEH78_29785, partial [Solibacterales bacterium]|nr:hypothetical protein [Bryobacterales bacterium]
MRSVTTFIVTGWLLAVAAGGARAAEVRFEGRSLLTLHATHEGLTAEERALLASRRLAARRPTSAEIRVNETASATEIYAGSLLVVAVTDADAAPQAKSRQQAALEAAGLLRSALSQTYV